MNIITCYKLVPEEQDLVINADHSVSWDKAEWKIGTYDLNGVEAGMQLIETIGGKVTALSVGDNVLENAKLKKAILSRGPEELITVVDHELQALDGHNTAKILAAAVKKIGAFDLILCGEGSSDLYAQQVGIQLGELLGVITMNAISKITPQGDKILVERTLEDVVEVLEIIPPAVLSVSTDINVPRIPTLKEILAAGKKPVTKWSLSDLGEESTPVVEYIKTAAPEQADRKHIVMEGATADNINKLYAYICQELA